MQCADFNPVLQKRIGDGGHDFEEECEEIRRASREAADRSTCDEDDETTGMAHKGWTPTYSPAYAVGAAKTPTGPQALPPPPGGASPMTTTSSAAPSSRGRHACTGRGYKFFSDSCSPAPSSCRRFEPGSSPKTPKTQRSQSLASKLDRKNGKQLRIDPDYVPRPSQHDPVKTHGGKVYETEKYTVPPCVTEVCTVRDTGSCSCEFIRCTVNEIAAASSTTNQTHIPLAAVCQPFAELTPEESPVPLVNFAEIGPFRCTHCTAYVNPFFTWHNWGRQAKCNFCGKISEVPDDYVCVANERGLRRDHKERPELRFGTVDYVAPRDYDDKLPGTPVVVFVLDVSAQSVNSGLCSQVLSSLRQLVGFLEGPAARIALITFDEVVHLYACDAGLQDAKEIVVADIGDPFLPCSYHKLCVNLDESTHRAQFDSLLEKLFDSLDDAAPDKACGGSALKLGVELANACGGGHVMMFHGGLPNTGLGALLDRDDITLSGHPQGGGLLKPQHAPFYESVAADCCAQGVGVSVFCAPSVGVYSDMATLSVVPRSTGGDICYIPGFDPWRDGEHLHYSISRSVVQNAAYSVVFKLRCSKGLEVKSMLAPWESDVDDHSMFRLPRVSVDASAVFEMNHVEKLDGRKNAFLQTACLYTNRAGQRRIRVQTLKLPVTTSANDVFRHAEVNAVTAVLLRQAAMDALRGKADFKERLTNVAADILHGYRAHCARRGNLPQLILPEALKLLPLHVSAIRKLAAFRSGSGIRVDDRLVSILQMLSMPIAQVPVLACPRVYQLTPFASAIHGMDTGVGDNVYLPKLVRCSEQHLCQDGVYLMDNGLYLQIYVRAQVPQDVLESTFGCSTAADVPEEVATWAASNASAPTTAHGRRVFAICQQLRRERYRLPWLPLSVVLAGTPEEVRLLGMLAEDHVSHEMSYVDFLVHLHLKVMSKVDD